jgi:hypothetical protein
MAWAKFFLPAIGRKGIATFSRLKDIFYRFCGYLGAGSRKAQADIRRESFLLLAICVKALSLMGLLPGAFPLFI